jgi:uncharacterized protein
MKYPLLVPILFSFLLGLGAAMADDGFTVPKLTGPVVDEVGAIGHDDYEKLSTELRALSDSGRGQVAVLITKSLQGHTIEEFGIKLAEAWKIGTKDKDHLDRGAIFIVAPDDHRMRIEVGYGLEGEIPDVVANQILERIVKPRFRDNQISQGIVEGTHAIAQLARGEGADAAIPSHSQVRATGMSKFTPSQLVFGVILFLALFVAGTFRQIPMALFAGIFLGMSFFQNIIAAIFIAVLLNLVSRGLRLGGAAATSGGFWGGGFGGGGSGGWGGGGGGGFSGGGGSFGGGGSSSSW